MISNFFVISPRGDTIIAKDYRGDRGDVGAHERSHTEAFFRKIKFWDEMENGDNADEAEEGEAKRKANAPPVFIMPDGLSYCHVKRNGLIFGCATARNISPTTVIQVSLFFLFKFLYLPIYCTEFGYSSFLFLATTNCYPQHYSSCRLSRRCSRIIAAHSPKKLFERTLSSCMNFLMR